MSQLCQALCVSQQREYDVVQYETILVPHSESEPLISSNCQCTGDNSANSEHLSNSDGNRTHASSFQEIS